MKLKDNTGTKIWFLIGILTICFFVSALTIRLTFDSRNILINDAVQLEQNLHRKEKIVFDLIEDVNLVEEIKAVEANNPQPLEQWVLDLNNNHQIFTYAYSNNSLVWWSTNSFVPRTDAGISDGSNILKAGNGWYYSIKRSWGSYSMLFLIPIKWEYQKTNAYLNDRFHEDLVLSSNLDMADFRDTNIYNIRSSQGKYLFSVKLHQKSIDYSYMEWELLMWILGVVFFIINLNILCSQLFSSGRILLSILIFGGTLFGLRYVDLYFDLLPTYFQMDLLDPKLYASSFMNPNLGAFVLNILFITWFLGFLFAHRKKYKLPKTFFKTPVGLVVYGLIWSSIFYVWGRFTEDTYFSLVNHSSINFNVTDILNLDAYGWTGLAALSLSMISFLYLIGIFIYISKKAISDARLIMRYVILFFIVIGLLLYFFDNLDLNYFLICLVVLIGTWYGFSKENFDLAIVIATLLLLGGMTSIKHNEFHKYKRQEAQKYALLKLEDNDDVNALALFYEIEKEIIQDPVINRFFSFNQNISRQTFLDHIKTVYLSGYLSKYDYSINYFDASFNPLHGSSAKIINDFRDKVISGAIKVTDNFYRGNAGYGRYDYFAQFPIYEGDDLQGILLLELNNRSFNQFPDYPVILSDSRIDQTQTDLNSEYSYAFYTDGELISQNGRYTFPMRDSTYLSLGIRELKHVGYHGGFSHMAYRTNEHNLLILSKPEQGGWLQFASLSFFFLVYLLVFFILYVVRWIFNTLTSNDFSLRNLRWSILLVSNRVLFSTRIQTFIVSGVVFTLIVAGVITFYSVSRQNLETQEKSILQFTWNIANGLESRLHKSDGSDLTDIFDEFDAISESFATDLNLYNSEGALIYTTQPRIYDLRLISQYINPHAYINLKNYGKFQFVQNEKIGDLNYLNAYASIRNDNLEPIAYLGIPEYSSQLNYDKNIGSLLNALLNIYALVILVLGLFAVFAANKMTEPLLLVQKSLAKIKIGEANEPLFWKRNDEIGNLIREYNYMIAELEESAKKIMKSERESAWREMAKQVAHEIKNPLTPLKLGMQQLERSWKDGDPNFETRFQSFSKSFIEQVDSLTHIASEFSNFAKMPDTKLEKVNLIEIIKISISLYKNVSNIQINLFNNLDSEEVMVNADKDQLLRVFNNLIKNGVEASVNRRKPKINILVEKSRSEGVILVDIQDFGEGIPFEAQKKLFQPNFTTKSSGTGLGLAFVKRAIESMEGEISYETHIGKGTSFFISLPVID